jgi:hypothetical protein
MIQRHMGRWAPLVPDPAHEVLAAFVRVAQEADYYSTRRWLALDDDYLQLPPNWRDYVCRHGERAPSIGTE